ncbi:hypothetical protein BYT27DRAFT_6589608 [Phlegmacium glaucopus]|nr:hypothetical protein BYT27DRAFT_6589608 [Phlegmacium glaucopus]
MRERSIANIRWNLSTNVPSALPKTRILSCLYAIKFCVSSCAYMRKIIDSIMALFRVDFSGRGELSERQQKVGIYFILCHVVI